eukprot:11193805-Lingulodinium_polyedra.AAC.1
MLDLSSSAAPGSSALDERSNIVAVASPLATATALPRLARLPGGCIRLSHLAALPCNGGLVSHAVDHEALERR